jgi:uncharacterized protein
MKKLAIRLIQWYQRAFSGKQPTCRFKPTCSNYAIDAYRYHNFFYASLLTIWRIIRCNPLVKGGYDPIPKFKKELKAQLKAQKESQEHNLSPKKDDASL